MKRPDALVITRNLPPLVGGMERLIWHIIDELNQKYQIHVIGPEGCRKNLPIGVEGFEVPLSPLVRFLASTQFSAIRFALKNRPQIVFAGSGLTAPIVWLIGLIFNAQRYVYLHGLDLEVNHPFYRMIWLPFFRWFDGVMVNSSFTKQLAIKVGIPEKRIHILNPGVALPNIRNARNKRKAFRVRNDLGNSPVLLYVGRITTRKGFVVFLKKILPKIVEQVPDVKLLVIGDEPKYALQHRTGEQQRALNALANNNLGSIVSFMSGVDDSVLTEAYFASDALVFPVQELPYDHEGFGMVALEAAAHGLSTIAFASGGVSDAVADGVSGTLVSAGDHGAFTQAVVHQLNNRSSQSVDKAYKFASKFAWPLFGKKLRSLC